MLNKKLLFMSFVVILFIANVSEVIASADNIYFDIEQRKQQLQDIEYSKIKQNCMALNIKQPKEKIPKPVISLKKTKGYGSDNRLSDFSWFVMIHGGRALAGQVTSRDILKKSLLIWSNANALSETEEVHDAYYALKRGLLPIIINYSIIRNEFTKQERLKVDSWLDNLVKKIDKKFNGDVDLNNHRYLADSVLTAWGQLIGNKRLYKKGGQRFKYALSQMEYDGSLPLETRRGARALWYMRQSLANLTVIAQIYKQNNDELYNLITDGKSLSLMANYYISAIQNPLTVLAASAENYIPGPSDDFMEQDMGMLARRGGKRHYMAFSYAYINNFLNKDVSAIRLQNLMNKTGFKEEPLIDDYIGGNATCFWAKP